jgi:hypothetical protein
MRLEESSRPNIYTEVRRTIMYSFQNVKNNLRPLPLLYITRRILIKDTKMIVRTIAAASTLCVFMALNSGIYSVDRATIIELFSGLIRLSAFVAAALTFWPSLDPERKISDNLGILFDSSRIIFYGILLGGLMKRF